MSTCVLGLIYRVGSVYTAKLQGVCLRLSSSHLGLEGGGHLWGRWTGKTQLDLNTIIDEPLKGGQGSNHNDPGAKTLPESGEAKGLHGSTNACAWSLVEVGHQGVGGVGHDGAEDTSNVASGEGDNQLFTLGAFSPWLGDNVVVESHHGLLKAGKLHHGVGDLPDPQGHQGLEEAVDALSSHDLGEGTPQGGWEGAHRRGLDPHLTGLHGGEGDVGEELSRGRGCQVESGHVEVGVLLSHGVSVNLLENFIEAKLAKTLGRVTDGSWGPAKEKARGTSLLHGELEAIAKVLVLLLVNLETALDQVKGGDHCVGDSTGENTSKGAESKVFLGSKLTAVFLSCTSSKLPQGLLAKALAIRRGSNWLWEEGTELGHVHLLFTSLL